MSFLPREAIIEFQEIYKKEHGVELSFDEAKKEAEEFMEFFKTIYSPIKKEWVKNHK